MSYSRRSRYASQSRFRYRGSGSSSRSRSHSRSYDSSDVENPGNNLYVTGLSSRITKDELEKHFASEGEVVDVHLVVDPWTRESRGFGFVTMATLVDAERCIKYLDRSVLEGRVITVEKARRRRGRTPTPGRYLGYRTAHVRHRSPSYSPYYRSRYRSRSYSSERDRSYSPYDRRDRSYSPYYRRYRSLSRSPYSRYSRSPIRRYHRSYSSDSRSYSMDRSVSPYCHRRYRSMSHSVSPRRSPPRGRSSRRSYSRSVLPRPSWRSRRNYSRSYSPTERRSNKSPSCSVPSRRSKGRYSRESYSHSRSMSPYSRSASRSPARS